MNNLPTRPTSEDPCGTHHCGQEAAYRIRSRNAEQLARYEHAIAAFAIERLQWIAENGYVNDNGGAMSSAADNAVERIKETGWTP